MRILIGADVVATESNYDAFVAGNISGILGDELKKQWEIADIRIFNMEAPITNVNNPIQKNGICLSMSESVMAGIKGLNPTIISLANNHILDQGQSGLINTMQLLDKSGISYVGVGNSCEKAAQVKYVEEEGITVGIYACAEHEFSIIEDGYGANPYNPLETFDHIAEAKKHCDYLIVLYHGGRECYRYPTPDVQKRFRKMAEKGANCVIAQHTHCIGSYEDYQGAKLIYGQGNFIFDLKNDEYWNSGMLVDITLDGTGKEVIEYIPYLKNEGMIRAADEEESTVLMKLFENRSEAIKDSKWVNKRYQEYLHMHFENAFRLLHGNSLLFRIINRLIGGGLVFRIYKKNDILAILNMIECESHREMLLAGLKTKVSRKP